MTVNKIAFRKKLALNLFRKYRENEKKLHQINYILWECTLRCNLNCIHCGSDCKKNSAVHDMPQGDFLKAIDQLKGTINPNSTMIVLTGGEALLRKDLEQIGENLYNRGFPWGFVTNGMLLNQKRLESLLRSGLRAVTVSLDGFKDAHNWLRGNNYSFENTFNAIKLLQKTESLKFDVVTCVNQKNFNELEKLKELFINNGVKNWRIFTIFPIGRAMEYPELQLPPREFKELFDFIKKTRIEKRINLSYGCEGFLGSYECEVRDSFFFCRAGINIASVLADGSISACPNLRENFIQGNIYRDNFADVWQNRYKIFRNREWTKTGPCSDCDFFKYCDGNGMHLRNEKNGELLFCHFKRILDNESIQKK